MVPIAGGLQQQEGAVVLPLAGHEDVSPGTAGCPVQCNAKVRLLERALQLELQASLQLGEGQLRSKFSRALLRDYQSSGSVELEATVFCSDRPFDRNFDVIEAG